MKGKINYGYWGDYFSSILEGVRDILYNKKLKDSEKVRRLKIYLNIFGIKE